MNPACSGKLQRKRQAANVNTEACCIDPAIAGYLHPADRPGSLTPDAPLPRLGPTVERGEGIGARLEFVWDACPAGVTLNDREDGMRHFTFAVFGVGVTGEEPEQPFEPYLLGYVHSRLRF